MDSKRGSKRRAPLTPELIASRALALLDAEGMEALSMRSLGASLRVEAMALYYHYPSKGALLDAVAEVMLRELRVPTRDELPDPVARVEASLRAYRGLALAHPRAFILLTTRRFATPGALRVLESILAPLAELGVDDATLARLFRLGGYFVGGAGMAEIASRAEVPDATPRVMEGVAVGAVEAPPLVRRVAPHLRAEALDAIFEFGLAVVMGAVREAAASARPGKNQG